MELSLCDKPRTSACAQARVLGNLTIKKIVTYEPKIGGDY